MIGGVCLARRLLPRVIASPDPILVRPLVVCQEVPSHPIQVHCSTNFAFCQKELACTFSMLYITRDLPSNTLTLSDVQM